ncbi:MAG: hypothetical protein RJB62_415 [Pseudomonadota bacterium]|jgi:pilus assembly protein CpaB
MNVTRIAVLGVAAIAAVGAALLVRGMLGGNQDVEATVEPEFQIVEVMVATDRIEPGRVLTVDQVRWEEWPSTAISDELITQEAHPEIAEFIVGAVARAPLIEGEPITEAKIVRTGNGTFLSATLGPGKRAVSIPISAQTGAGGFVLPNDRVDVILTREISGGEVTSYRSDTIVRDIRVLAIDQTFRKEDGVEFLVASTATLELAPSEAELIAQAQSSGELSLALRGLGDEIILDEGASSLRSGTGVNVLRYGVARAGEVGLITGGRAQ